MHPKDRPIPDADWIQAATDDAEDGAFYQSLSDRYTLYDGPLTWDQYVQAAEQERDAADQDHDGHADQARSPQDPAQYADADDDTWF